VSEEKLKIKKGIDMGEKFEKTNLLNRFLETASNSWDNEELEQIRPTIVRTAEAIHIVEQIQLKPEEEPVLSITHFHQHIISRENEVK
jgi:hypothetical protein